MRVQVERDHHVVTDGPYRYARHPAYAGAILYELATPVLFASWWAFIPRGLNTILLILRTALEDRTLQAELPGYTEYTRKVRYRLLRDFGKPDRLFQGEEPRLKKLTPL